MNYPHAITEKDLARERLNYAACALELAQIKMRLAELKDQHAPLAALAEKARKCENYGDQRARLYAVAFYAVVGRWPDGDFPA